MFVFSLHLQFAEAAEPKPKPGETRERESSLPIITTRTDGPTVPAQKRKESAPPELLTKASPNSSKKL